MNWTKFPVYLMTALLVLVTGLLGMGANAYDVTHINNKMCFDFARSVGCAYTPECQWVDLYLSGDRFCGFISMNGADCCNPVCGNDRGSSGAGAAHCCGKGAGSGHERGGGRSVRLPDVPRRRGLLLNNP